MELTRSDEQLKLLKILKRNISEYHDDYIKNILLVEKKFKYEDVERNSEEPEVSTRPKM